MQLAIIVDRVIRVTRWTKGPLKGEEKEEGGGIGIEGEEKLEVNEKKKEEKRFNLILAKCLQVSIRSQWT